MHGRRPLTRRALVAAVLLTSPLRLAAQAGPRLGQEQIGLRRPAAVEAMGRERPDLRDPRQTQWVKGGVIGGTILSVGSFLLLVALADYQEGDKGLGYYLEPTVISAGLGFVIGALIGGQFAKK